MTDLLPTALIVASENGSNVRIYPDVEDSSISYEASDDSGNLGTGTQTQHILVDVPENITFFHCQKNITFTIGKCYKCMS